MKNQITNEKQEYWNKRVQDTQIKLNKLAWSFAQAEINLKNNFTDEYNVLKEDEKRFMESAANSAEIESEEVEEVKQEVNDKDKVSDLPDGRDTRNGETATAD